MSGEHRVGCLRVRAYGDCWPHQVVVDQMHANGTDVTVGSIKLSGDDLDDAIYALQQAKMRLARGDR